MADRNFGGVLELFGRWGGAVIRRFLRRGGHRPFRVGAGEIAPSLPSGCRDGASVPVLTGEVLIDDRDFLLLTQLQIGKTRCALPPS
jgi:hypothetical protein